MWLIFGGVRTNTCLPAEGSPEDGSDEAVVGRTYVKKKLEHGLNRIWQVKTHRAILFVCLTVFFFGPLSHPDSLFVLVSYCSDSIRLSISFHNPMSLLHRPYVNMYITF